MSAKQLDMPAGARAIPLANSDAVAIVDEADYAALSTSRWLLHSAGYACRTEKRDGKRVTVLMHRVILGAPNGVNVDHRDGRPLNNRRANLRPCTQSQNCANAKKRESASSRYKGVARSYRPVGWRAQATLHRRNTSIGYFATEEEAARAYDAFMRKHFGEFARTNFPEEGAS